MIVTALIGGTIGAIYGGVKAKANGTSVWKGALIGGSMDIVSQYSTHKDKTKKAGNADEKFKLDGKSVAVSTAVSGVTWELSAGFNKITKETITYFESSIGGAIISGQTGMAELLISSIESESDDSGNKNSEIDEKTIKWEKSK